MKRLPLYAFGVLALASIGAVFLVQHLKVGKPLLWNTPYSAPSTFDPVAGKVCKDKQGVVVDYRTTVLGIKLQARPDTVGVYVVADGGTAVKTLSTGTPMQTNEYRTFAWNGRSNDGRLAPAGYYYLDVDLLHQGRTVRLSTPVHLITSQHPAHGGCFTDAAKQ